MLVLILTPIRHSLSPRMHNDTYVEPGLDFDSTEIELLKFTRENE